MFPDLLPTPPHELKGQSQVLAVVLTLIIGAVALYVGILVTGEVIDAVPLESSDVVNETITMQGPAPGNWTALSNDNLKTGSVAVYNASGAAVPSSEYNVNHSDGSLNSTLSVFNASDTSTTMTSTDNVSYTHEYQGGTLTSVEGNIGSAFVLVGVGFIVLAAAFILTILISKLGGLTGLLGRGGSGRI